MREFLILIGELMFIATLQLVLNEILDEVSQKWVVKLINISGILISYFLLLRYVYNNFIGELTTMVNFNF